MKASISTRPRGVVILGGSYGSLAVARSLGRSGVPVVYFAPPYSPAALSRYVTKAISWRGIDEPAPVQRLLETAQSRGLDGWLLLPADDFGVQLVAQNRDRLAARFVLQTLDWSALQQLNDKSQLYPLAARHGLATPAVHAPLATPAGLSYPVVIKPKFTKSSNALTRDKAWRCDNAAAFAARQAEAVQLVGAEGFVVQQHIAGSGDTQLSYAALWDQGKEVAHMTALRLRQYPLEFGTSPFVVSVLHPQAAAEARKLLAAVGYHGLVEVEFKLDRDDGQLKLLDVNTRIWAWIGLGGASGVDFARLAFALARGEDIPATPGAAGKAWRRQVPSALSFAQSLRRYGRPGLGGWRSLLGPAQGAVFALDDPLPGLSELPLKALQILRGAKRG